MGRFIGNRHREIVATRDGEDIVADERNKKAKGEKQVLVRISVFMVHHKWH